MVVRGQLHLILAPEQRGRASVHKPTHHLMGSTAIPVRTEEDFILASDLRGRSRIILA